MFSLPPTSRIPRVRNSATSNSPTRFREARTLSRPHLGLSRRKKERASRSSPTILTSGPLQRTQPCRSATSVNSSQQQTRITPRHTGRQPKSTQSVSIPSMRGRRTALTALLPISASSLAPTMPSDICRNATAFVSSVQHFLISMNNRMQPLSTSHRQPRK